jgi:hypothetical protein
VKWECLAKIGPGADYPEVSITASICDGIVSDRVFQRPLVSENPVLIVCATACEQSDMFLLSEVRSLGLQLRGPTGVVLETREPERHSDSTRQWTTIWTAKRQMAANLNQQNSEYLASVG